MMNLTEAKKLVGKVCSVSWLDRNGTPVESRSRVHDVTYVAMYGGYLILDRDDVQLDRIISLKLHTDDGSQIELFRDGSAQVATAA